MIGFANLHILTVSHGEVYVHHFWMLAFVGWALFNAASSSIWCRK